jgi:eukaryotic-like serine/threonine-protein kinase
MDAGAELVEQESGRRFRLVARLGSGGFGSVWLAAVHSASGIERQVAVKLIHADADERAQGSERLRDEARVLAKLRHPVILATHDLVQLGDRLALVTEYVEGEDLGRLLVHPTHPMPLAATLEVCGQVAGALDTAWRALGLVHRDVKPANIRVGRHGNVKLLDFGIARSIQMSREARTGNGVVGSPGYLAPERFVAGRRPHPGSDVFALGCVIYEGAAGVPLYKGLDIAMVCGLSSAPPRLGAYLDGRLAAVPAVVRELLVELLAYDPDLRPDAREVAARCEQLAEILGPPRVLSGWCRTFPWTPDRDPTEVSDLATTESGTSASAPPSAEPLGPPPPPAVRGRSSEVRTRGPAAAGASSTAARVRGALIMAGSLIGLGGLLTGAAVRLLVHVLTPAQPPSLPPSAITSESHSGPAGAVARRMSPGGTAPPRMPLPAPDPLGPHDPPGWVRVIVMGAPGTLYVDGRAVGRTNTKVSLPVGQHSCQLRRDDDRQQLQHFPCMLHPDTVRLDIPLADMTD